MKNTKNNLWLCGKNNIHGSWEFAGIFSTEQKAINACKNENYFIASVGLDSYSDKKNLFP
jgi:hypothetical protein